jgi:hypothetical protein
MLACHQQGDVNLDSAYHFDADPDSTFQFDADHAEPDPDPQHWYLEIQKKKIHLFGNCSSQPPLLIEELPQW